MRIRFGWFWAAMIAAALATPGRPRAGDFRRSEIPEYVMADFEGTDPLTTPLQGYWYFADDRYTPTANDMIPGNSLITSFDRLGKPLLDSSGDYDSASLPTGHGGAEGTRSLRVAYVLGDRMLSCGGSCRYDPFIDFGLIFTTRAGTLDLTGAAEIAFWGKADSDTVTVDVAVGTDDTTQNAADYAQTFAIGPAWTRCVIRLEPSAGFRQPERSAHKPFDLSRAYGLKFGINRGGNARAPVNGLSLDDVVIANWSAVGDTPDAVGTPREAPRGIRPIRISPMAKRTGFGFRTNGRAPVDARGRTIPIR